MNEDILFALKKMQLRSSDNLSNNEIFEKIQGLPSDYKIFMLNFDGGVGFLGEKDNYLDLWSIQNIRDLNPYFPNEEFSNSVIIIGSNGSGMLYGYDPTSKSFFETDEYQMNKEEIIKCGTNFLDFVNYLNRKKD